MGDRDENRATCPSSDVIKTEYFVADLLMEVGEGDAAERVAMTMRMQNNLTNSCAAAKMAPISWECDDGLACLSIVGRACGRLAREDWWPSDGTTHESGYTVGKVAEYLENVFDCAASVRALEPGFDHPDDLKLMDSFRRLLEDWPRRESYPSAKDVMSAGKQQESLLGSEGSYAQESPYFSVVLRSKQKSDSFNREAYAAACKSFHRAMGSIIVPETVFQLEDGRWEVRMLGTTDQPRFYGRAPRPADTSLSDAMAYYLDAEVREFRTFGTTVADADDIVEAERIADELEGRGVPEPEDFVVSERDEVMARDARVELGREADPDVKPGIDELDELIGLTSVKEQIIEFVDYAAAQKKRGGTMPSLHMWMTGNPGTGKTTVARIIGHMLHDRGLISKRNVFVEGDRETLVGQYIGHTAVKTKAAVKKARHGVLFIDEAYALDGGSDRDYGSEALAVLVKAMEDCRSNYEKDGFVCIMAGYPALMEKMVSVNPGLRDRFGFKLEFPDYSADELCEVFGLYARKEGYTIEPDAEAALAERFEAVVANKDDDFGNARLVRRVFERCEMRQARLFGPESVMRAETIKSVFEDDDIAALLETKAAEETWSGNPIGFAAR